MSDAGLVLGLIAAGAVDLALLAALAALFLRRPSRRAARARPVVSLTPQDYRTLTALEGDESGPDGVRVRRLRVDERGEFKDRWPKGFFAERMEELL